MNLEENSVKDPIDFATNLTLASMSNAIDSFRQKKEAKEAAYKVRLERFLDLKAKGKVDPDFDPDYCEECGEVMPQERKDSCEVLCTPCKTAQERADSMKRR